MGCTLEMQEGMYFYTRLFWVREVTFIYLFISLFVVYFAAMLALPGSYGSNVCITLTNPDVPSFFPTLLRVVYDAMYYYCVAETNFFVCFLLGLLVLNCWSLYWVDCWKRASVGVGWRQRCIKHMGLFLISGRHGRKRCHLLVFLNSGDDSLFTIKDLC